MELSPTDRAVAGRHPIPALIPQHLPDGRNLALRRRAE